MSRTLWGALGEVPDRRGLQGQQYKLQSLLGISIGAMLAGANDLRAIFRWGRRLKPEALKLLGIEDCKAPCHATYHYVFKSLDADALAFTLGRLARGDDHAGHIAIDGKTLKGSRRQDAKALHVLSAFATDLGAVIGDLMVEPDQNEITAAMTLLKELPLDGAVITGDAIFCQREILSAHSRCERALSVRRQRQPARAEGQHRRELRRSFPPQVTAGRCPPPRRRLTWPRQRPSRRSTAGWRRAP